MRKAMIGLAILTALGFAAGLRAKAGVIECIQFNEWTDADGFTHTYVTSCF